MTRIPYTKLVGAGNDFILIDALRHSVRPLQRRWPRLAQAVCDRRQGIGADGLLVLGRSRVADVRMRIFNPDGTEPSMCGNGIRCAAWYVSRQGMAHQQVSIETNAGIKQAQVRSARRIRINMGVPRILEIMRRTHAVLIDVGVPHLVCWVDDVAAVDVETLGRRLRHHRRFQPNGVNVDFVESVQEPRRLGATRHDIRLKMRTYERGVEGETRACGTGAVAAAAAAVRGQCQAGQFEIAVRVPGGLLRVSLGVRQRTDRGLVFSSAFLEGGARQVSRGTVTWNGRRP